MANNADSQKSFAELIAESPAQPVETKESTPPSSFADILNQEHGYQEAKPEQSKLAQYAQDFKAGATGVGADFTAAANQFEKAREIKDANQVSDDYKKSQEDNAKRTEEARNSGVLGQAIAAGKNVLSAPGHFLANSVGGLVPYVAANLASTAAGPVVANLAEAAATPALMGIQSAGGTKLSIYENALDQYKKQGLSDEEAKRKAEDQASYTGGNAGSIAASGALGAIAGKFGNAAAASKLSKNVAGSLLKNGEGTAAAEIAADTAKKSLLANVGQEAAIQGAIGGVQGAQGADAINRANSNAGFEAPSQSVIGAGVEGALGSGAIGGLLSLHQSKSKKAETSEPVLQKQADQVAAETAPQIVQDASLKSGEPSQLEQTKAKAVEPEQDLFGHDQASLRDEDVTPDGVYKDLSPQQMLGDPSAPAVIDHGDGSISIADPNTQNIATINANDGAISSAIVKSQDVINQEMQSKKAQMVEQANAAVTPEPASQPIVNDFSSHNEALSHAKSLTESTGVKHDSLPFVNDSGEVRYKASTIDPEHTTLGLDPASDHASVLHLLGDKSVDTKSLASLADNGLNLNAIGPDGTTPVTHALASGNRDAVQKLSKVLGADVNAKDGNGRTPLAVALMHGDMRSVSDLIKAGADPRSIIERARSSSSEANQKIANDIQAEYDRFHGFDESKPVETSSNVDAQGVQNEIAKQTEVASTENQRLASESNSDKARAVDSNSQGYTEDEFKSKISKIFNGMKDGLGDSIVKIAKFKTADQIATETGRPVGSKVQAFVEGKDGLYFVHDQISKNMSDREIEALVHHEIGVHAAKLGVSDKAFKAILNRFGEMVKNGNKEAIEAMSRVPESTHKDHRLEEGLAYFVENNMRKPTSKALGNGIVDWFKASLRGLASGMKLKESGKFLNWVNSLSSNEVSNMASQALKSHVELRQKMIDAKGSAGEFGLEKRDGYKISKEFERDTSKKIEQKSSDDAPLLSERKMSESKPETKDVNAEAEDPLNPKHGFFADFQRRYVNKFNGLHSVVRAVEKKLGKAIDDKYNPILATDLEGAKAQNKIEEFNKKYVDKLVDLLKSSKITLDQLSETLQALHAPERNAVMRESAHPDVENKDALSGMSNEDAAKVLGFQNAGMSKKEAMQKLGEKSPALIEAVEKAYEMVEAQRKQLVSSGLESRETVQAWGDKYQFYVPLKREGFDDMFKIAGRSPAGIRGSSVKKAVGSDLDVQNVVAHIILDAHKAYAREAENNISKTIAGFIKKYDKQGKFGILDKSPEADAELKDGTVSRKTDEHGNLGGGVSGFDATRPSVASYRVAGKDYAMVMNEKNHAAMETAAALSKMREEPNQIDTIARSVTNWISKVNTQLNPFFGIKNLVRDTAHAVIALENTPLKGKKVEFLKNQLGAFKTVWDHQVKGEMSTNKDAQLYHDMLKSGGEQLMASQFKDAQEGIKKLARQVDPDWFTKTAVGGAISKIPLGKPVGENVVKLAEIAGHMLEVWNSTLEAGTRLAVYKTAKESGMSAPQSASLSRNLTVNFERKGSDTTRISAYYGFFNAAVQGTASVGRTIFDTSKKGPMGLPFGMTDAGRKIIVGGLLVGIGQAAALQAAGFKDGEVSDDDQNKNLMVPIGDKKSIAIPMAQGFSLIPAIGRLMVQAATSEKYAEKLKAMLGALVDNTSPIGWNASFAQTLAPSALDPVVQLYENKDFAGNQIAKLDRSNDNPTPGFTRTKDSATAIAKFIAYGLNYATGGTDFKPGAVSPTPDQIDFIFGVIGGGVLREGQRVAITANNIATGEETMPNKVPLVSGYLRDANSGGSVSSMYHKNLQELNQHANELKGRAASGGDVAGYRAENPAVRYIPLMKSVEGEIAKLQKQKAFALKLDNKDQVKAISDRITEQQRRLNDRLSDL